MASSWKVCNALLCKMGKIGLSRWQRSSSHGSGLGWGSERVTIKSVLYKGPPSPVRAAMPRYLRGLGCLHRGWYYCPLCSLQSLGRRIRFQQVWRCCLFLTRQVYKASILKKKKKKCGGVRHSKAMPNLLFLKVGRDKGNLKHTSQTQRTCVYPPNSSWVNSAHYPRSWSLILPS